MHATHNVPVSYGNSGGHLHFGCDLLYFGVRVCSLILNEKVREIKAKKIPAKNNFR